MRVSTEALSAGRSVRLVRDQIEADLIRRLERVDSALLTIVLRQVGLAHDVTAAIAHHIAELQAGRPSDSKQLAARAGQIERKADRIAIEARKEVARLNAGPIIEQLVDRVEEFVDQLEQAAFIASLAPAGIDPAPPSRSPSCAGSPRPRLKPRRRGSPPPSKSRRDAAPTPKRRSPLSSV